MLIIYIAFSPGRHYVSFFPREIQEQSLIGRFLLWLNTVASADTENRLVVAKGEGGREGMDWESGISRCKLLYIEWINNKDLLYSTGNYTQYPVINHNGK